MVNGLQLSTSPQIADAVKWYSYLLCQMELFQYFVDIKVCVHVGLGHR
jgi:hypothetical protein